MFRVALVSAFILLSATLGQCQGVPNLVYMSIDESSITMRFDAALIPDTVPNYYFAGSVRYPWYDYESEAVHGEVPQPEVDTYGVFREYGSHCFDMVVIDGFRDCNWLVTFPEFDAYTALYDPDTFTVTLGHGLPNGTIHKLRVDGQLHDFTVPFEYAAVPEPTTLVLVSLGVAGLIWRRSRRRLAGRSPKPN